MFLLIQIYTAWLKHVSGITIWLNSWNSYSYRTYTLMRHDKHPENQNSLCWRCVSLFVHSSYLSASTKWKVISQLLLGKLIIFPHTPINRILNYVHFKNVIFIVIFMLTIVVSLTGMWGSKNTFIHCLTSVLGVYLQHERFLKVFKFCEWRRWPKMPDKVQSIYVWSFCTEKSSVSLFYSVFLSYLQILLCPWKFSLHLQ